MENKQPNAVKILSTLIELYADQCGVKVTYKIENAKGGAQ